VSETPRVDQVHWNHAYLKEEAYKLERELNAAQQRIKRLESVENSHAAVLNAIDNWIQQYKSEEAKP